LIPYPAYALDGSPTNNKRADKNGGRVEVDEKVAVDFICALCGIGQLRL